MTKKNESITRMEEQPIKDWLSTGCTILDLAISNQLGGIPAGRSTHIYGWESTAKSVLAQEPAGAAQRKGGHVWFLDAEETLDFSRAKDLFGLDINANTFHYDVPGNIEELFDGSKVNKDFKSGIYDIIKFIKDNDIEGPNIAIVDSLSALATITESEQDLTEGTYGMSRAKQMSTAYRKYLHAMNDANLALLIINQARVNIGAGPFGDKMVVSGGKALDFYASTSIALKMSGKIKNKNKQVIGCKFKFEVKKNKIAPPHRKGEFKLLFDYGIDNVGTNLEWLKEINDWKKYKFKDFETSKGGPQSLEEAIHYIEDNELEYELEDEVAKVWNEVYKSPERKERTRRR